MILFTTVAAVAEVFAAAAINSPGMISSGDFCNPITTSSVVADSGAVVEFTVVGMLVGGIEMICNSSSSRNTISKDR